MNREKNDRQFRYKPATHNVTINLTNCTWRRIIFCTFVDVSHNLFLQCIVFKGTHQDETAYIYLQISPWGLTITLSKTARWYQQRGGEVGEVSWRTSYVMFVADFSAWNIIALRGTVCVVWRFFLWTEGALVAKITDFHFYKQRIFTKT